MLFRQSKVKIPMHWTSILTALVLSLISAFLVLSQGWTVGDAFWVTGGVAAAIILGLVGILLILSKPEHRRDLASEILATMRRDFKELLRWMQIKR